MDIIQIKNSIAYCGLICGLCRPDGSCGCKGDNHCGKRLSPQGCYQYNCCTSKEINGCWECSKVPCDVNMLAPEKIKLRAFVRCIKEDGIDQFAEYIAANDAQGIVYHRCGIIGDYDLNTEEAVLALLRNDKGGRP